MSRPLRIEWPGGLFHVTSRGDRREPIVEDDGDRRAWVQLLQDTGDRFNWRIHAWCLMTNHYHVVLETPEGNLSSGMRHLNGVWSQQFNRRHGRVGHVFQGRFKAIIVHRQSYLLELARYVVLNPVRAGMVGDAGAYAWSSYNTTVKLAEAPEPSDHDVFEPRWLLAQFAPTREEAVLRYVDFVRAGVGLPSIWLQLQNDIYLGSTEFVLEMQARLRHDQPLAEVPLVQRRPPRQPLSHWQALYPRNEAMAKAFASGHWRQCEIALYFGVSVPTVSRAVGAARGDKRAQAQGCQQPHRDGRTVGLASLGDESGPSAGPFG
jgi:putative transposase